MFPLGGVSGDLSWTLGSLEMSLEKEGDVESAVNAWCATVSILQDKQSKIDVAFHLVGLVFPCDIVNRR